MPDTPAAATISVPPSLLAVLRDGPEPLIPAGNALEEDSSLSIAFVGPGDNGVAEELGEALVARGHAISHWPAPGGGMSTWHGADVAIATGWRATWRVLALPHTATRVLLVTADEEERLSAGPAHMWVGHALRSGLHVLCAEEWLAKVIGEEHGVATSWFARGIDESYRPLPTHRRDDLVLLDAPAEEPWRGAPLALLAGSELLHRRPDLTIGVARGEQPLRSPYPLYDVGSPDPMTRADAYGYATLGVVCAADGASPVIGDMQACGLPVVAIDAAAVGPNADNIVIAPADPLGLAYAIEGLLDDLMARAGQSLNGTEWGATRTWAAAAAQAEDALRTALRATEP